MDGGLLPSEVKATYFPRATDFSHLSWKMVAVELGVGRSGHRGSALNWTLLGAAKWMRVLAASRVARPGIGAGGQQVPACVASVKGGAAAFASHSDVSLITI